MKCEKCNKPVESDFAQGMRLGRNMGLFYGFMMGALAVAFLLFLVTWK